MLINPIFCNLPNRIIISPNTLQSSLESYILFDPKVIVKYLCGGTDAQRFETHLQSDLWMKGSSCSTN